MANYYVSRAQKNGDHEVHEGGCRHLPSSEGRVYVGTFSDCMDAVREARKFYSRVDGCRECCSACHTLTCNT